MTHSASPFPTPDLQSVFESAPGAYLVLTPDLTIVAVSDAYVRDVKTTRENILGRKLLDLLPRQPARSNAELESFAYVASHDLREPLRMVSSYVQLLARRYQGKLDADADIFIQFAVDGVNRMKDLIDGLLNYSRVCKEGKDLVPTSSQTALNQALVNLQIAIQESGATVTCDPLPTLNSNGLLLVEIFQNLVGNALKFRGDPPPHVHIGARRAGPDWIFAVQDNGIGIDPKHVGQLFGIFRRLHPREKYPGTGIGLAICKKIIEKHEGRLWVESQLDQGATFYFTIPAGEERVWLKAG